MRNVLYFVLLAVVGCSSDPKAPKDQVDKAESSTNSVATQKAADDVDFRTEFILQYGNPIVIDTSFVSGGRRYEIAFRHFSSMDSGLIVPAKYNFDTKEEFVTHNFVSELKVFAGADTIFEKHITKELFGPLLKGLNTPLSEYATLLYPTLEIAGDSILIHYSVSIPVTDVGLAVYVKFDKAGGYLVR